MKLGRRSIFGGLIAIAGATLAYKVPGSFDRSERLARRIFYYVDDLEGFAAAVRQSRPLDNALPLDANATVVDLENAVRADFAANRTVSVDGWIISDTEARLLASMLP